MLRLGNFIFNNYRQALEKKALDGSRLERLSADLKLAPADYDRFLEEEREYLKKLKVEDPTESVAADYIVLLRNLEDHEYVATC